MAARPGSGVGAALPDGNALVRGLLERQRRTEDALDAYAYDIERVREHFDGRGRVTKRRARRYQVFHVKGRPVRTLVAEHGRPLTPGRRAREERRTREMVAAIRAGEVVVEEPRRRLSAILERHDFRTVGREDVAGRAALVLEFGPREGAGPDQGERGREDGDRYRRLSGRVWVDEDEHHIVRVAFRNAAGARIGLGGGASVSALEATLEFRKVDGAVWLPWRVQTTASGRALFFKRFRVRQTDEYGGYRRFDVEAEERIDNP